MGKFQNYPQEIRDKKKEFVMVFSSYRKFSIKYFYIFIPLELKYRNMFGSKLLSSLSSTYWKMLFSKTLPYFLCKNLKKCQRCFRIQIKLIKWLKNVCPKLIQKKKKTFLFIISVILVLEQMVFQNLFVEYSWAKHFQWYQLCGKTCQSSKWLIFYKEEIWKISIVSKPATNWLLFKKKLSLRH